MTTTLMSMAPPADEPNWWWPGWATPNEPPSGWWIVPAVGEPGQQPPTTSTAAGVCTFTGDQGDVLVMALPRRGAADRLVMDLRLQAGSAEVRTGDRDPALLTLQSGAPAGADGHWQTFDLALPEPATRVAFVLTARSSVLDLAQISVPESRSAAYAGRDLASTTAPANNDRAQLLSIAAVGGRTSAHVAALGTKPPPLAAVAAHLTAAGDTELGRSVAFVAAAAAITAGDVGVVAELHRRWRTGELRGIEDLTAFREQDWIALLAATSATAREDLPRRANDLISAVGTTFPGRALTARILADNGSPLRGRAVVDYLTANPATDLLTADLGSTGAAATDLRRLQRLAKITPRHDHIAALWSAGHDSAADVARQGRAAFILRQLPVVGEETAAALFDRAAFIASRAFALYAEYSPTFNRITPQVLRAATDPANVVPDWRTLFADRIDLLTEDPARSVLSPAAYLTDTMHFLDSIPADPTTALAVLLNRRGELNRLQLGQANTDVPVPHIDVVNELLECAALAGGAARVPDWCAGSAPAGAAATGDTWKTQAAAQPVPWDGPADVHVSAAAAGYHRHGFTTPAPSGLSLQPGDRLGVWVRPDPEQPPTALVLRWAAGATDAISTWGVDAAIGDPVDGGTIRRRYGPLPTPGRWTYLTVPADDLGLESAVLSGIDYGCVEGGAQWGPSGTTAACPPESTDGTDAERRWQPQQVLWSAYQPLTHTVFPWRSQPFDVGYTTAAAVCGTLGVPLAHLSASMSTNPQPAETLAVALARLGISPAEHLILTGGDNVSEAEHWGLTPDPNGAWFQQLTEAAEFLPRAELSAVDMRTPPGAACCPQFGLGRTTAADGQQSLTIVGLDQQNLPRLRRYLRLWRLVGGDSADLERFWASFAADSAQGQDITDDLLIRLSIALTVADRLGVGLQTVTAWWTPTVDARQLADPAGYPDDGPLSAAGSPWSQIFRRPDIGALATAFALDPNGQLVHQGTVEQARPALCAALRIADDDLTALLVQATVADPGTTALTVEIASGLLRTVSFCRAANMTLADYLSVSALSGIDAFDSALPANLQQFLDVTAALQAQPTSIAELDYLLRHVHRPGAGLNLQPVAPTLAELTARHQQILDVHQMQPDPTGDLVRREVAAGSTGVNLDDVMAALAGAGRYAVPLATDPQLPADAAAGLSWSPDTSELVGGVLTTAERDGLRQQLTGQDVQVALDQLYQQPRTVLERLPGLQSDTVAALLDHGLSVEQRHEQALQAVRLAVIDTATVSAVIDTVTGRLNLTSATTATLLEIVTAPDGRPAVEVLADAAAGTGSADEAGKLLVRLDKAARLISQLNPDDRLLDHWLTQPGATGWLDVNTLPDSLGSTASLNGWLHLCRFHQLQQRLTDNGATLIGILRRAGDSTDQTRAADLADTLADLSDLAGWNLRYLQQLCDSLALSYPDDFRTEGIILRLEKAIQACNQLGAEPTRVAGWVAGPLTADIGADMLAHAHAHTSAPGLLQQVEDGLRMRRRNGLRDYLSPSVADAAQTLSQRLLIDVDVAPDITTTRIAAATHAVQLLLQRALLDLEPALVLNDDLRQEWSWMSSYSTWQANRETFLHPENYLIPDSRTDGTEQYTAFNTDLTHGELTDDDATTALRHYLSGLDEVAQLEPAALYLQTDQDANGAVDSSVLHVIGRTRATPHRYHHRTRTAIGDWSDWQSIGAEIGGENLCAYELDRVLHLFWLEPLDQGKVPDNASQQQITQPELQRQYRLAWTVQEQDTWSAKKLSIDTITVTGTQDAAGVFLDTVWTIDSSLLDLPVRLYSDPDVTGRTDRRAYTEAGVFRFDAAAQSVTAAPSGSTGTIAVPSGSTPTSVTPDHQGWRITDGSLALPSGSGYSDGVAAAVQRLRLLFTTSPNWIVDNQRQSVDSHQPFFFDLAGLPLFVTDEEDGTDARTYLFELGYHPYTKALVRELVRGGAKALLDRDAQLNPEALASDRAALNFAALQPTDRVDSSRLPVEAIDFTFAGPYSKYNWELFYHAPLLIAQRLTQVQRFSEARAWLETVFDPTDRSTHPAPSKYWQTKPLFQYAGDQGLDQLIAALNGQSDNDGEKQITAWLNRPFDADIIARLRQSAYQKATVMAYLDNLIAWADALLINPTAESVPAATQLYLLAADLLGPAPLAGPAPSQLLGDAAPSCYQDLRPALNSFSDAVTLIENRLAPLTTANPPADRQPNPAAALLPPLYFQIPVNDKLLSYWDVIDQRLTGLRAGLGPQGQPLTLPPYPPAGRAGQLPGSVLDGAAPTADARPVYRFSTLFAKATELTNEVRSLGAALLAALEKHDAETLAAMRANHELTILSSARGIKQLQVTEAGQQIAQLEASRSVTASRASYYRGKEPYNQQEKQQIAHLKVSAILQATSQSLEALGTALSMIPEFNLGVSGFAGSPVVTAALGGRELSAVVGIAARVISVTAGLESHQANMASISAGWQRRWEDWQFQLQQANLETFQIDAQIAAAETRALQAQLELAQQDLQIQNSNAVSSYLQNKFTTADLYDWMAGQLTTLYGQAYRLAVAAAGRAQRAYQFELADSTAFVTSGYWDGLHMGLSAADRLSADLRRMETAYLERNTRAYEITKNVSLALHAPEALLSLRTTGECYLDLPESLFDLDYPGHYLRRLHRVLITIPCVTGPYTGVNCTLSLLSDHTRLDPSLRSGKYTRQGVTDPRFGDRYGLTASIVTSGGVNQSGAFDGSPRDDRYEPFEGAGAVSRWRIQLPPETNSFPLDTLPDVVLQLQYTARDGGQLVQQATLTEVVTPLRQHGTTLLRARSDFPDAWLQYQNSTDPGPRTLTFGIEDRQLPSTAKPGSHIVDAQLLILSATAQAAATITVTPPGGTGGQVAVAADPALGGILDGNVPLSAPQPAGDWSFTITDPAALPLTDLLLLVSYAP